MGSKKLTWAWNTEEVQEVRFRFGAWPLGLVGLRIAIWRLDPETKEQVSTWGTFVFEV